MPNGGFSLKSYPSITQQNFGSHDTVTAYGSLAADGRQFFRTYDRFNATTFVEYLKSMHRCFRKIAVIADRARPHSAKLVRDLSRENKEIKIIYLPKGSPYLIATCISFCT